MSDVVSDTIGAAGVSPGMAIAIDVLIEPDATMLAPVERENAHGTATQHVKSFE
jgi:isocitrate dehydrogenase